MEIDPSIIGREFDRSDGEPVLEADLIAFSRALGETDPRYVEPGPDLVAHPTYCTRFRGRKFFPPDLPPEFLSRLSFDAGKDVELGAPIRPGDVLTVSTSVHDVYEKTGRSGPMTFVVVRSTLTNQEGALVATIDNRMMYR
jgi:acyl dehydratase